MSKQEKKVLAWHFVGGRLRDGSPVPPDGVTLVHEGTLVLCPTRLQVKAGCGGYHGSRRLIDALRYAPGSTICRSLHSGEIIEGDDKLVSRERKYLWHVDGAALLRDFARRCALDVADLWPIDEYPPVREYLETGREELREAARCTAEAAEDAVRSAAWSAVRAATWATAAWSAAWGTARTAAEAAAEAAGVAAEDVRAVAASVRACQNLRLTAAVMTARCKQALS